MTEPVVHHRGREGGVAGNNEARPSASTACWAAWLEAGSEAQADNSHRAVHPHALPGAGAESEVAANRGDLFELNLGYLNSRFDQHVDQVFEGKPEFVVAHIVPDNLRSVYQSGLVERRVRSEWR
jgi:hypothetical protein